RNVSLLYYLACCSLHSVSHTQATIGLPRELGLLRGRNRQTSRRGRICNSQDNPQESPGELTKHLSCSQSAMSVVLLRKKPKDSEWIKDACSLRLKGLQMLFCLNCANALRALAPFSPCHHLLP